MLIEQKVSIVHTRNRTVLREIEREGGGEGGNESKGTASSGFQLKIYRLVKTVLATGIPLSDPVFRESFRNRGPMLFARQCRRDARRLHINTPP